MATVKTSEINWEKLRKLRDFFLSPETRLPQTYWDRELLSLYDATFARRIRVKWDHVLTQTSGFVEPAHTLLDWGCGSGVATEAYLETIKTQPAELLFYDSSRAAVEYCQGKFRTSHPSITSGFHDKNKPPAQAFTLLISHVLNELPDNDLQALLKLVQRAQQTIWVEPGSKDVSRRFTELRDSLRESIHVIAPCPHTSRCGMNAPGNEENWCHFFCKVPSYFSTEAFWRKFSEEMQIDLRSIPLSYLMFSQNPPRNKSRDKRIIGTVRTYKGYQKFLLCKEEGVAEFTLQQRDDLSLFKRLKKDPTAQWD
ncbi:MAG: small ribosomal subunit Rsm22 family protein [Oligoflexales bacterium]